MKDKAHEEPRLLLVGTVHLDPAGFEGLLALLRARAPGAISVEVSPYAIAFRQREGDRLRGRLRSFGAPGQELPGGLESVYAQLGLPFEHRAAEAYAREAGIAFHLLGDSERSRELLGLFLAEVMAEDNLAVLARRSGDDSLARQVEQERGRARRSIQSDRVMGSAERDRLAAEDARMAEAIRAVAGAGLLCHVCGWEHLAGLARRLSDLGPEVLLLRG